MFILNCLLKYGGVKRVDKFLDKFFDLYSGLSVEKQKEFIELYLKYDFDVTNPFKFAIFHYIKGICNEKQQMDKLLQDSNYFRTMPNEFASGAINAITNYNLEGFLNNFFQGLYLRISEKGEFFNVPLTLLDYKIETLVEAILAFKSTKLINSLLDDLDNEQKVELNQKMGDYFTALELKDYCIGDWDFDVDYFGTIFAKALHDNQSDAIDAILEVVLNKQKTKKFCKKLKEKDKKDLEYFVQFVKETSEPYYFYNAFTQHVEKDEHFSVADKEAIALKIKDLNDANLMYYWVINTKCGFNYLLIDELLNSDKISLLQLFFALDEEDLVPTLRKFSKSDKDKKRLFISELANNANKDNIARVDSILAILLYSDADASFTREECISLMSAGSNYFRYFIDLYLFTNDERMNILSKLEMDQLYDVIAVYGAYLISGDKSKLIDDVMIGNNIDISRNRKNVK